MQSDTRGQLLLSTLFMLKNCWERAYQIYDCRCIVSCIQRCIFKSGLCERSELKDTLQKIWIQKL